MSIKSQEDLAKKYQTLDCQLEFFQKRRMPVKPDRHFLPRAIFTALKKPLISVLTHYKQLLRKGVCKVNRGNHSSWMSDQAKTTELDLKEYSERKFANM